jgi:hypothetical protein
MPISAIEAYLDRLPARMAEMKLSHADAVSVPHMKEQARKQATNEWMRTANLHTAPRAAKRASPARLKLMGIGFRNVK